MKAQLLAACLLTLSACNAAPSRPAGAAEDEGAVSVMVVGTYHFGAPNQDLVNVKTDDVLTPQRQEELAHVAAALAEFRPTVIVTERVTAAPDYVDPVYASYSGAMLAENPDERVQVAYRLAAAANVSRVLGIDEQPADDEPDYFPFDKLAAHAEATGQADALNALIASAQESVEAFARDTAGLSIGERLYVANTGFLSSPHFYYAMSALDQGEAQPAAELQAYWFMRNAKIFSKIIDVTQPGDRVLIVYGAGHKYWLEHFAEHTPGFTKIDPGPYLKRAGE